MNKKIVLILIITLSLPATSKEKWETVKKGNISISLPVNREFSAEDGIHTYSSITDKRGVQLVIMDLHELVDPDSIRNEQDLTKRYSELIESMARGTGKKPGTVIQKNINIYKGLKIADAVISVEKERYYTRSIILSQKFYTLLYFPRTRKINKKEKHRFFNSLDAGNRTIEYQLTESKSGEDGPLNSLAYLLSIGLITAVISISFIKRKSTNWPN